MRQVPKLPVHPAWWSRQKPALQLFRALAALQRVHSSLEQGTLAWRRLERDLATLEASTEALRQQT